MNNQKDKHFLSKILDIEEGRYKIAQEAMQIINGLNDDIEGSPILENIGKPAIYAISHVLSGSTEPEQKGIADTNKGSANTNNEELANMDDSVEKQDPLF